MRLIQIPFSHNCIKVRRALEIKGLAHETLDISPMDRRPVVAASGQGLVPVLVDGGRTIADSTEILRHLEATYPEPSLLPASAADRALCWLLEDWVDRTFMAMTRRMAYWHGLHATPDAVGDLFFPQARGLKRWIMLRRARQVLIKRFHLSSEQNDRDVVEAPKAARLALDRLGSQPGFFGDRTTVADIALATMAAPLHFVDDRVLRDPAVEGLLRWAAPILGEDVLRLYRVQAAAR